MQEYVFWGKVTAQLRTISWEDRHLSSIIQHQGSKSFSLEGGSGWQCTGSTRNQIHTASVGNLQATSVIWIIASIKTLSLLIPYHKLCIIFIYWHIFLKWGQPKKKKKNCPLLELSWKPMHNFREDSHLYEHMSCEQMVYLDHATVCKLYNFL